ncbi:MAG: hypothetical protein HIU85_20445 [Proteobacteria bacterium]|nr:hypothetical protein [Pseudomonadota bacterium]
MSAQVRTVTDVPTQLRDAVCKVIPSAFMPAPVGGLAGSSGGASVPISRLKGFEQAIGRDRRIPLMLDVQRERGQELESLVHHEAPNIEFVGF